ncbi:MAG: regulatory protein RecX [Lachnospiraceae bacterium]|nr:regulatory protein RecX [Lachnospiraceae bacterium]
MKVWRQEDWVDNLAVAEPEEHPAENDDPDEAKRAREKAVYYLQFSGKTEHELRKKLAEQEFSPASVDSAIEFVKSRRYLDDEDYARRFVERNGRKKSRKQMIFDLNQKGVSREIIDVVLEEMEVDEESQILTLLEKKQYSGDDATREEKQRISAYLARKGFSYEAISSALIQYARKN